MSETSPEIGCPESTQTQEEEMSKWKKFEQICLLIVEKKIFQEWRRWDQMAMNGYITPEEKRQMQNAELPAIKKLNELSQKTNPELLGILKEKWPRKDQKNKEEEIQNFLSKLRNFLSSTKEKLNFIQTYEPPKRPDFISIQTQQPVSDILPPPDKKNGSGKPINFNLKATLKFLGELLKEIFKTKQN